MAPAKAARIHPKSSLAGITSEEDNNTNPTYRTSALRCRWPSPDAAAAVAAAAAALSVIWTCPCHRRRSPALRLTADRHDCHCDCGCGTSTFLQQTGRKGVVVLPQATRANIRPTFSNPAWFRTELGCRFQRQASGQGPINRVPNRRPTQHHGTLATPPLKGLRPRFFDASHTLNVAHVFCCPPMAMRYRC